MSAISVKAFNGLKPIADPVLLDNSDAQIANNVLLTSGAMRPMRAMTVMGSLYKTNPVTIYRFDPQNDMPEEMAWLEFAQDTDVMRSPIAQDQFNRLYWTDGDNQPKYAPDVMVLTQSGDGSLPGHGYDLGVPKPTTKPTITDFTGTVNVVTVTRTYVLTYVDVASAYKESAPGKPFTVQAVDGQSVKLTGITTDNRGNTAITAKNIYRLHPTDNKYHGVVQIPLSQAEYEDTTTDATLLTNPLLNPALANLPQPPQYPPLVSAATPTTDNTLQRGYFYTLDNYVYNGTHYDKSPPSPTVNVTADSTQTIHITGLINNFAASNFSIYRADGDKVTALLVQQIPTTQPEYYDVIAQTVLGLPIGEYHGPPNTAPPAPTLSGGSTTATPVENRLYMVTFVDGSGHESARSPESEVVQVRDGDLVALSHSEPVPDGVTRKRLYRQAITLANGIIVSNDANWKLVAENTASATSATDAIKTADLPGGSYSTALQNSPPVPLGAPGINATVPASVVPESRVYCYTLVTAYDEEGPPSDSSDVISCDPAKNVTLAVPGPPSGNYNFAKKRIYRSATGTQRTKFQYVGEMPVAVTQFIDSVPTSQLSELLETEGWIPPPKGLRGLRMMANGCAVGFVGNSLYLSEPNLPHAWPHEYPIDDHIIAVGTFGQSVAVLTNGFPYLFTGVDPAAMASNKLQLPQGCVNKRSIVETGEGVLYASPDGLTMLGQGATLMSQSILSRAQWQSYNPSSMECFVHNGRVLITYDTGADRGMLVFDISGAGAMFTTADINAALPIYGGHYVPQLDTLYFVHDGSIKRFDDGAPLTATWKSKVYRQGQHDNFGFAQVLCKSYAPFPTLKVYADGVQKYLKVLTGPDEFRLPSGFKSLDWEFQIEGTVDFNEVSITSSTAELQAL